MSGPIKPMGPPNLHGHTCVGVSGELYAALLSELGPAAEQRNHGSRYVAIGPNAAIYPRFDPPGRVNVAELFAEERRRAEASQARSQAIGRWGLRALVVAALPFVWALVDWLATRYGDYFGAVARFFGS